MLILLQLIFKCCLAETYILPHLFDDLVIDRHGVEAYNNAYNVWLGFFYFSEELQPSYLGERYAFLRVSGEHFLDDLYCIDTDITWKHVETLNYFFVKLFGCRFLKRKGAAHHRVKDNS